MSEARALELIHQARERRATRLNLSKLKLTELPPEIGQLTDLKVLWLNDNRLQTLPPEIGQLRNLRRLRLQANLLIDLPSQTGQLDKLLYLTLDSNQFAELPYVITQLASLEWLSLDSNQLTELSPDIAQLISLKWLSLDNNQLTELPHAITQLTNLRGLYLDSNQLSELPPAIAQLTSLEMLYLSKNQLTELPPHIGQLTSLKWLTLDSNQVTKLPHTISQLTSLQGLYMDSNQLTELPHAISQLPSLQRLTLNSNLLTELPHAITQLTSLQRLTLNSNQLTELPHAITQLTSLQRLTLNSNLLTELPPYIAQLNSLEWLSLDSNQLTELPPDIAQLISLKWLSLNNNQLTELPHAITQLTNLRGLYLDSNQLSELPPDIGNLKMLESLFLANNKIERLPFEIGLLSELQLLCLGDAQGGNQLTELPSDIGRLTSLKWLTLNNNQLTELPSAIAQLTNLQKLWLVNNQLTELPPVITQLTNLQELSLDSNQLTELPPAITQLTNLQELSLDGNQLTDLSPAIAQLTKLQSLFVSGNENMRLAPEVIEGGAKAILAYLSHVQGAPKEWVSKMLVVGEGAVGKTSLLRALRGEEFEKGLVTTHGIETGTLQIAHPELDGVTMNLNTWDFGGQQIYHATHQFFLTNRSLYVLVWNARMGFEQCKLNYWLDTIEARAPQSPIILVATHTDERKAGLPLKELQERYPQIVSYVEVSNRKGKGLEQLKQAIAEASASLPLMGERWPTEWAKVRDTLRKRRKRKKYIDPSEYDDLMAKHNVTGIEERVLTNWLHELGEIIYFREVDELKDTVILDSQWVTQAISQVLESEEVKKGLGLFTRPHMNTLWRRIEAGMRDHMLKLMEQFDLSYRTLDNKEISIVVERLDFDPPTDIEPKWACLPQPHNEISMKFSLDKTMPAGIPTWFIARQHRFTTYNHWRYGALFADEKRRHWGLVQAFPHDRYLRLIVRGPAPHNFFALLRSGLELTLDRFKGLKVEQKIPCPGKRGEKPCSYEFELEHLERRLELTPPKLTIECPECLTDVPVPSLLVGIRFDTTYERLEQIHAEVKAARDEAQAARLEMREITTLLQRELTSLFNAEQTKEESHCPYVYVLRDSSRGSELIGLLEPIRSTGTLEGLRDKVWKKRLELQLYCQEPGCWHPLGYERGKSDPETGLYQVEISSDFMKKTAPYLVKLGKVMKYAQPVLGPWVSWVTNEEKFQKQFKDDLKMMKDLSDAILPTLENTRESKQAEKLDESRDAGHASGAMLRALRLLLEDKDKEKFWGGLRAKLTKEGHWLWLCPHHFDGYKD